MQRHTTRPNKMETNAKIEAPRGGEILYSAPLSVSTRLVGLVVLL